METSERDVLYYQTTTKTLPFRDWRLGLDGDTKAVIDARVARFRSGNFGDSKSIGGGASENRIHYGPGYRIYYGLDGKQIVILLCGGDKSTQNVDIKLAQQYWADYKKRKREREKTKKKA
jgi:putative addiction module killer protein